MFNLRSVAMAAVMAVSAATAQAATVDLSLGDGWVEFYFGGDETAWEEEFRIGSSIPLRLQVTDAYLSGDRFEVFSDGTLLGATSLPGAVGAHTVSKDEAFASPTWSSGAWLLAAGSHLITGVVTTSPFGSGAGAVRLVEAVPQPAVVPLPAGGLLLLTGLGAIVALRRRR